MNSKDLDRQLHEIFVKKEDIKTEIDINDTDYDIELLEFDQNGNKSTTVNEDNREKCGEIYLDHGKLLLFCNFCMNEFENLEIFSNHMFTQHIISYGKPESKTLDDASSLASSYQKNRRKDKKLKLNESEEDDSKDDDEDYIPSDSSSVYSIEKNCSKTEINTSNINNKAIYWCKECKQKFEGPLDKHECKRLKKFNHKCDKCGFSTRFAGNLSRHKARHHQSKKIKLTTLKLCEDPKTIKPIIPYEQLNKEDCFGKDGMFYCPTCDIKCIRFDYLRAHYRQKHGTETKKIKHFRCEYCNKIFVYESQLTEHIKGHSEKLSVPCKFCTKVFKWRQSLMKHMKAIHPTRYEEKKDASRSNEDKPFKCDLCKKCFRRKYLVREHRVRCERSKNLITTEIDISAEENDEAEVQKKSLRSNFC